MIQIIFFVCLWLFQSVTAQADLIDHERNLFQQARAALLQGNYSQYKLLREQLHHYPLYPYLIYYDLKLHIDIVSESEVINFMHIYKDTPLAERLRHIWLLSLAKQQRWALVLKYYQSTNDTELNCLYAKALLIERKSSLAWQILNKIWLTGNLNLPTCYAGFSAYQAAGKLTPELSWLRVRKAMQNKDKLTLKNITFWLKPPLDRYYILWQKVSAEPELIKQKKLFIPFNDYVKDILIDGIERLAKKDPLQTAHIWQNLQAAYGFSVEDEQKIFKMIAINLARHHEISAEEWLLQIDPAFSDSMVQEWRIRIALLFRHWEKVKFWIQYLNTTEQQTPKWRYWYARALAETGSVTAAQTIYQTLSKQLNYYGWRASQQLKQRYQPIINPYVINTDQMVAIYAMPSIQRAHELYLLKCLIDARREWEWGLAKLDKSLLPAAAKIAQQWGWHDRAIITAVRAGWLNDISLRYPLAYQTEVMITAKNLNLDPAWIYAIMRQESIFISDVKSSVGALGLMQLMPQTASILIKNFSMNHNLLDATTNIELGSRYLQQLSNLYNGNKTIASAAYNVGPGRLKKYLPHNQAFDEDIWIDTLPWHETRDYVKNVLFGTVIYHKKVE